jgi:type I restriction enzyme S subunit
LTEYLREIVKLTGGSTQINLNTNLVKKLAIAVPPEDEIEPIVELIFKSREQYKALQEKAHQTSELLQERRTALISAAVTGKIDVRGWKPPAADPKKETEREVA